MEKIVRRFKNNAHLGISVLANLYYGFGSKSMKVIGITGTDGKTTTANLIYHILVSSGTRVAIISTVGAIINGKKYDTGSHVTTPSSFLIQKYLKIAKNEGCNYVVIEVTSHAIDQNRVRGINFYITLLTNITHEHLDYHKTYNDYVNTKLKFLKSSELSIVNSDGEWFEKIKDKIPSNKLLTYSLSGTNSTDITIEKIPFKIKTLLVGDFNMENILAAIMVCQKLGVDNNTIESSIETFIPPKGRQEEIDGFKCKIIIDFAHTPNAFKKILIVVKNNTSGRLIHIFGSAGERDKTKRSTMGEIASKIDDVIILTAEDPRHENVNDINDQIMMGISKKRFQLDKNLFKLEDRGEAIKFGLEIAAKDDTILITGKGHETSMNYGGFEREWNDEGAVRREIETINSAEKV